MDDATPKIERAKALSDSRLGLPEHFGRYRILEPPGVSGRGTVSPALREAHAHGVIHRDLKPSNIMMNQRQEPIIMDFGLARRAHGEEERLTKSGTMIGTPAYIPPEQINGDLGAIGPHSDVYSLGVILYESLTGRRPFDAPSAAVLAQILFEDPAPPST